MEYSTLGRTGATVSHLGFGGAVLGLKDYIYQFDPADVGDLICFLKTQGFGNITEIETVTEDVRFALPPELFTIETAGARIPTTP